MMSWWPDRISHEVVLPDARNVAPGRYVTITYMYC
jgi:hypothetical protein